MDIPIHDLAKYDSDFQSGFVISLGLSKVLPYRVLESTMLQVQSPPEICA